MAAGRARTSLLRLVFEKDEGHGSLGPDHEIGSSRVFGGEVDIFPYGGCLISLVELDVLAHVALNDRCREGTLYGLSQPDRAVHQRCREKQDHQTAVAERKAPFR